MSSLVRFTGDSLAGGTGSRGRRESRLVGALCRLELTGITRALLCTGGWQETRGKLAFCEAQRPGWAGAAEETSRLRRPPLPDTRPGHEATGGRRPREGGRHSREAPREGGCHGRVGAMGGRPPREESCHGREAATGGQAPREGRVGLGGVSPRAPAYADMRSLTSRAGHCVALGPGRDARPGR